MSPRHTVKVPQAFGRGFWERGGWVWKPQEARTWQGPEAVSESFPASKVKRLLRRFRQH